MFGTLGGLYFGLVTTTEAAVVGCFLSIVLASPWHARAAGLPAGDLQHHHVQRQHPVPHPGGLHLFHALSFAGLGEQVTHYIVGLKLSKFEFYIALFIRSPCWAA